MQRAMQTNIKVILLGLCSCVLSALPAHADDTEIFFGAQTAAVGTVLPNVLFILDTSGSMSTTVSGTGKSRLANMQDAFRTIMASTKDINAGLMRFNDPGGPILYPATNISSTVSTTSSGSSSSINSRIAADSDDAEETGSGVVDLTSTTLDMAYGAPSGSSATYNAKISTSSNDAEETLSSGSINRTSTTINMTSAQINGFYFPSVSVPKNATIVSATLTFTAIASDSADVTLGFYGQAADNPSAISTTAKDLSSRAKTTATVSWNSPPWIKDSSYTTADLSGIISEIVHRTGWVSGNNLAILQTFIAGGQRRARSYDNSSSAAATLNIVYTTATAAAETVGLRFNSVGVPQGATVTSAVIEFTAAQGSSAAMTLTVRGEAQDNAPTYTSAAYSVTGRAKTAASVDWAPDAWATGDVNQTPELKTVVQEIVNRSGWCGNNSMAFQLSSAAVATRIARSFEGDATSAPILRVTYDAATVPATGGCINQDLIYRVSASNADAEETTSGGAMSTTSSTLDMITTQTNGLQFDNVMIKQGSTILSASLEFTANAANTGTASVTFLGDKSDDASVFTSTSKNITNRTQTTAAVTWSPPNWSTGVTYASPDLKTIVQEVVNRTGWTPGNALAFVQTTGSGTRRARTYDGSPGDAALLRIRVQSTGVASTVTKTVGDTLIDIVNDFTPSGYTPIVDVLYEGAQYFRGGPVLYGKTRGAANTAGRVSHSGSWTGGTLVRDSSCTDANLNSSSCASEHIDGSPVYKTPITVECQANYIVLLTDGEANHNNSTSLVPALMKTPTSSPGCATQTNTGELCGRELVNFLNTSDQLSDSVLPGSQTVSTYTIGFNLDPASTAVKFLQDLAAKGNGTYFTANTADQLASAFSSIVRDIKSVDTTFVAPSATVSQFNRLTNGNDLYFSLFKPSGHPVWAGNLKKYAYEPSNGTVVDVNGNPAIDTNTGYFKSGTTSYWSTVADGSDVALGGAAGAVVASSRKVYTNTTGTSGATLSASANALTENNTAVTKTLLGIDTWSDADRTKLLQWARGVDVLDSNGDGSTVDTRLEMGDPVHSRPVIINYASSGASAADSIAFIGTNQGYLHAVDTDDGVEVFSFVPRELLPNLQTFYTNSSGTQHLDGLDGPISDWTTSGHKYLYVGMRRGGRNYYALDVTDRNNPKLMWTLFGGSGSFGELGESWSELHYTKMSVAGTATDVLVFAGGYDDSEDTKSTRSADAKGRAIYIVNATTGAFIWSGGPSSSGFSKQFADMQYAIPSDVRVIDINNDGLADQMYVGDMGGQIWRFDVDNAASSVSTMIKGGVIANLNDGTAAGNRRFFYAPDISIVRSISPAYLTISVGSGWRTHPLDTVVQDRFYMIRNTPIFSAPTTYTKVTESMLFDATDNTLGTGSDAAKATAKADLDGKKGWYVKLTNSGEKVLAESSTVNSQVVFTTYQPGASTTTSCTPSLGVGRVYVMSLLDATPVVNLDKIGSNTDPLTTSDRSQTLKHSGIPPSFLTLITTTGAGGLVGGEQASPDFGSLRNKTFWQE